VRWRQHQLALVLSLVAGLPWTASAHFGPAEPPDFGAPECIVVVDLRRTKEVVLPYEIGFDDTEPELGHIIIEGSKTHQFFAWRGTVLQSLPRYEYRPYAGSDVRLLPLWLNLDDLTRADAANDPSVNPDFHASNIGTNVLQMRDDIAGQWLEVSTMPARVPITIEQGMKGVRWDLTGVQPGVYQLVSYTFSPPFNAWEPRPGIIKVIDGATDTPAVTLDSIDGMSYAGQGWRVTGCVDAPAGSTVSGWYRVEAAGEVESEASWKPWLKDEPLRQGKLDLCFNPEQAGLLHVRVAVHGPDGRATYAYTPDALVRVDTPMKCLPGDAHCCEAEVDMPTPAVMQPTAAAMGTAASMSGVAAAGTGAPAVPMMMPDGRAPMQATAGGCAVLHTRSERTRVAYPVFALLALAIVSRRQYRARRRSRYERTRIRHRLVWCDRVHWRTGRRVSRKHV
jgi:hypothetical protein